MIERYLWKDNVHIVHLVHQDMKSVDPLGLTHWLEKDGLKKVAESNTSISVSSSLVSQSFFYLFSFLDQSSDTNFLLKLLS